LSGLEHTFADHAAELIGDDNNYQWVIQRKRKLKNPEAAVPPELNNMQTWDPLNKIKLNGNPLSFSGNPYPFNGNPLPFMETIFFAKNSCSIKESYKSPITRWRYFSCSKTGF
jgi:hypothetical protein